MGKSLNPLKIGSVCNFGVGREKSREGLNPLKIGSVCNLYSLKQDVKGLVSIPLKSGLFVILLAPKVGGASSLNPLKIGSVCNNSKHSKVYT